MHSYQQYCGLAKALDAIGSRWSLLIVRELLIRGPSRYTDLRDGLPGIATNMLADRLRELEEYDVVSSAFAPPPVATTLFSLTPRGQALQPAVMALGLWGAPLLGARSKKETFRSHWIALPVHEFLRDYAPEEKKALRVEISSGSDVATVIAQSGTVRTELGGQEDPDVVLSGPPHVVLGILFGKLTRRQAIEAGLEHRGRLELLRRLRTGPGAITHSPNERSYA